MLFETKRRRRRRLAGGRLSAEQVSVVDRNLPVAHLLSNADRSELEGAMCVFLAEKNLEGCDGLELTDEIRTTVAAHACLLLLHRDTDFFSRLDSVLIYPSIFVAPVHHQIGDAVIEDEEERLGESSADGAVVVAWEEVLGDLAAPGACEVAPEQRLEHKDEGVAFAAAEALADHVAGDGPHLGNWDGHRMLQKQYSIHGEILDQPVAALIRDLKARGLFEDTLFAFVTEFGRMPTFQKGASGRDHNPDGFTVFLAGAGVKAPFSYGATDEFGHRAVEDVVTMHDFHATLLHLLGLDHEALTFYHNGIERRLTDVHGRVWEDIIA